MLCPGTCPKSTQVELNPSGATLEFLSCGLWLYSLFLRFGFGENSGGPAPGEFQRSVTGDYPHSVERYDNIVRLLELQTLHRNEADRLVQRAWTDFQFTGEPPQPLPDRHFEPDLLKRSVDAARKRLESMSKILPAFEALEHFRRTMTDGLEESRRRLGHDDLLRDVIENYTYS